MLILNRAVHLLSVHNSHQHAILDMALYYAAENDHVDCVAYLLRREGIDPNEGHHKDGHTVLTIALRSCPRLEQAANTLQDIQIKNLKSAQEIRVLVFLPQVMLDKNIFCCKAELSSWQMCVLTPEKQCHYSQVVPISIWMSSLQPSVRKGNKSRPTLFPWIPIFSIPNVFHLFLGYLCAGLKRLSGFPFSHQTRYQWCSKRSLRRT